MESKQKMDHYCLAEREKNETFRKFEFRKFNQRSIWHSDKHGAF